MVWYVCLSPKDKRRSQNMCFINKKIIFWFKKKGGWGRGAKFVDAIRYMTYFILFLEKLNLSNRKSTKRSQKIKFCTPFMKLFFSKSILGLLILFPPFVWSISIL